MAEHPRDGRIIERVMQAVEAATEGSPELDCMVSYAIEHARGEADDVTMKLLVMEGYSWDVISALWDVKVPPFTQSLDSRIEGENITLTMWSERRGKWVAVQRSRNGEDFIGWAKNEILARRLAALKAIVARLQAERTSQSPAQREAEPRSAPDPAGAGLQKPASRPTAAATGISHGSGSNGAEAENWRVLF